MSTYCTICFFVLEPKYYERYPFCWTIASLITCLNFQFRFIVIAIWSQLSDTIFHDALNTIFSFIEDIFDT